MKWRAGAVWFYWIAALAIAAALLHASGQTWSTFLNLGALQSNETASMRAGSAIGALVAAVVFFIFVGWFASAGQTWAFVLGVLAYAADGALCAVDRQWFALAVHVLILFFIYPAMIAASMRGQNESLLSELAIRAALAKDRAARPAADPAAPVARPPSADPLAGPQPFRPGVSPPPNDEE